jgi:hypothetical protein
MPPASSPTHGAILLTIIALGAAIYFFAVHNAVTGGALLSFPVIMLIRSFLTSLCRDTSGPRHDDELRRRERVIPAAVGPAIRELAQLGHCSVTPRTAPGARPSCA